MHTVGSAKAWTVAELKRTQVKSPALTADLLLAFVLGWDRVRVLSHPEHPLSSEDWSRLRHLVLRRAAGEPLQYLTGRQEFYGLDFEVGPGVLIPRPETEILVEAAISRMGRYRGPIRFLDIGTGSGCIAVSVSHEVPSAAGWAVDISSEALQIAQGNAVRHGVASRILLIRSSRLQCFPLRPVFDLILCNPPYVALKDCDSLPAEVRDYEPHAALFGGDSGLDFYADLLREVPPRLVPNGWLLLELGAGQADDVRQLVQSAGLSVDTVLSDLQGIPRCLIARASSPSEKQY